MFLVRFNEIGVHLGVETHEEQPIDLHQVEQQRNRGRQDVSRCSCVLEVPQQHLLCRRLVKITLTASGKNITELWDDYRSRIV